MFLFKLSLRNLTRHKRRTLITAGIIAVAIFYFIVFDAVLVGMNEMAYESIIDYQSGHIQIASERYWEEKEELPLENLLRIDSEMSNIIKQTEGFSALSAELNFFAQLNNVINELPINAKGIVPEQAKKVFKLENQFVTGKMFGLGEYKVVMGKKLADLMKLNNGDYITLLFRDKNDTYNTIEAEICGLLHTANPAVNQNIVYLPLDVAQNSLGVEGQVSQIIVNLEDKNQAPSVINKLTNRLEEQNNEIVVYPWNELEAVTMTRAKQGANQLILAIILLIAAIAIINNVILAALERMEEIGMMKSMGMSAKEIVLSFVLENTGIGLVGGLYGCLLGVAGVYILSIVGIDFGAIIDMDMSSFGIPVLGKLYSGWHPAAFIIGFSFAVLISLLASILPAYWAANKNPVDAMYRR